LVARPEWVTIVVNSKGDVVKACATLGPQQLRSAAEEDAMRWEFKQNFEHPTSTKPPTDRERYLFAGIVFHFTIPGGA